MAHNTYNYTHIASTASLIIIVQIGRPWYPRLDYKWAQSMGVVTMTNKKCSIYDACRLFEAH